MKICRLCGKRLSQEDGYFGIRLSGEIPPGRDIEEFQCFDCEVEKMGDPWESIKHFYPQEFDDHTSPGSGKMGMNIEFVKMLDSLRDRIGFPLHIDSGFRTEMYNQVIGGKTDSAHLKGVAADIACADSSLRFLIVKAAFDLGFKRIGIGSNFIHLDISYELPQNVAFCYYKENDKA